MDIGCGMIAVETNLKADKLPDNLDLLHGEISRSVPAGVGKQHSKNSHTTRDAGLWMDKHRGSDRVQSMARTAVLQLGTLGSGNHFVEVCLDENETVWVVIQSGSRGTGNKLANQHIIVAKALCNGIPLEDKDLAYFQESKPEFGAYINDML